MNINADKNLVLELFLTFSCFEFALKSSGWHRPPGRNDDVATGYRAEADWDRFAQSLIPTFNSNASSELAEACDYLLFNPPWRETVVNGVIVWDTVAVRDALSDVEKLLRYVRRVRNNLFHGGKFSALPAFDRRRNTELMEFSLVILKECLRLAPLVNAEYEAASM